MEKTKADSLTKKQEDFAKKYIETGVAAEAYRHAYDVKNMSNESIYVESSRLLENPKVSLRVKELQEAHAIEHRVTVEKINAELEQARALALMKENAGAMVQATMGKAKVFGLIQDKVEHSGGLTIERVSFADTNPQ